jgi:hypothetical protein
MRAREMLSVAVVGEDEMSCCLAKWAGLRLLRFHMRSLWREISNAKLTGGL